jgi:hypothetical protein
MFSEWLDEIPEDFDKNWIMCLCPVGKRCLVVASEVKRNLFLRINYFNALFFQKGSTVIYNKAGKIIYKHRSKLPGGGSESQAGTCI